MKIAVFGVGRSGTTLVYSIIQKLLLDSKPGMVDFVYEPFLWDRKTCNRPYSDMAGVFGTVASISHMGIHQHLSLPLLMNEEIARSRSGNGFTQSLLEPTAGNSALVAKLIRANGRMPLFRQQHPDAKFIGVVRNPVDSINSVINRFSWFGDDFHASDEPRFVREIRNHFGFESNWGKLSPVGRYGEYWRYMNQALLDFVVGDVSTHLICYEKLMSDPQKVLQNLAEFLGVPGVAVLPPISEIRAGGRTHSGLLGQRDFEEIVPLVSEYAQRLRSDFQLSLDAAEIIDDKKYANLGPHRFSPATEQGWTGLRMMKKLERARNTLA